MYPNLAGIAAHAKTLSSDSATVRLTNQFVSLDAVLRLMRTKAAMLSRPMPESVRSARARMTGFGSRRSFWYILTGSSARSGSRRACRRMYSETSDRICMAVGDEELEELDEDRHCTTWGKNIKTGRPLSII